jgi:PAP2 superfamily
MATNIFDLSQFSCRLTLRLVLGVAAAFGLATAASAQAIASSSQLALAALPEAPQPQSAAPVAQDHADDVTVRNSMHIFLQDQRGIWTSPTRLHRHDIAWIAPFLLATGAAIATDHRAQSQVVSHDPNFNNNSVNVSDGLVGGMIAVPVALFAAGEFKQEDDHAREAGILGGEAMVDGAIMCEAFKLVSWRERPTADQSRGRFFQSSAGIDGSFFSMHTTLAFASASVIAGEYHSPWTQIAAYTGATAVGVTRVLGRQHFPSDVLVGATAGWLIGHYVVKHHRHIHRNH